MAVGCLNLHHSCKNVLVNLDGTKYEYQNNQTERFL